MTAYIWCVMYDHVDAAWLWLDSDGRNGLNSELNVKGLLAIRWLLYRHQTHRAVDWCDFQQGIVLFDRLQSDRLCLAYR